MGLQRPPHPSSPHPSHPTTHPCIPGPGFSAGTTKLILAFPGLAVDFGSLQLGRVTGAKAKSQMLLALTSCGFQGPGGGTLRSPQ